MRGELDERFPVETGEMGIETYDLETGEDMLLSLRDRYKKKNKKYQILDEDKIRKAGW